MELLEVERLRRLAEIERRGLHERDGFLSAAAWLASRFKVAWGVAREHVRIARALDEMPVTQRALEEGEVSMSAVRILATAHDVDPEAFRRAEGQLVEAARIHSAGELQRVAAFWRQTVEQDRAMDGEEQLHAPPPAPRVDDVPRDGAGRLRSRPGGWGDAADRARSGARRRGALTRRGGSPNAPATACRCARRDLPSVARSRRPADGRGRASTRDGDRRRGRAARRHRVEAGARSFGAGRAFEVARRLACDASIRRVVMAGRSEPLDVGRRTHVVPPAMRRAVIVRDRHCRFPGCDRPHAWCDAHHVVHWADGGPTAVPNLLLLCRRHHRLIHRPRWFSLELLDGRPVFRRPDGSPLEEDRAPP